MKPRVFIYIHYLEIGGAERSLISLLHALDPSRVDVDLFLSQHTGEFMSLVPRHVRLLPELPEYSAIERPVKEILREGHLGIALRRLVAKRRYGAFRRLEPLPQGQVDEAMFQFVASAVSGGLRDLGYLGEYDLAISFLHPHNIVLHKVKARRKVCWVHTDYSAVSVDRKRELPVWDGFDAIAAVSHGVADAFSNAFPALAPKVFTMENILSPAMIRAQAKDADVSGEMAASPDQLKILSIGRFCPAKRFEAIPAICRRLLDKGLRFRWFIVGYGDDTAIRAAMRRHSTEDTVVLLGKKDNPYPYIAACDIYAQPSIFEGKSVTVREAQILCRPVVVTAYPTASAQIADGVDGCIVPLDIDGCAEGIYRFAVDKTSQTRLKEHLASHDYGNASEVEKIYDMVESNRPSSDKKSAQ